VSLGLVEKAKEVYKRVPSNEVVIAVKAQRL
jgi:hypothetical protein